MGSCESDSTHQRVDHAGGPIEGQESERKSGAQNPFYSKDHAELSEERILSQYKFHSHYKDKFIGQCDVLEEKATGNLYLAKQLVFRNEENEKNQIQQLRRRQNILTQQNVIQIKEIISKTTDGFFGEKKKDIIIIDYPFISYKRQIANRISKKIAFTKEEVLNFLSSTVKGYAAIEQAGYKTDKVRLSNIFVGIKNRQPIIKVSETNLLAPKSNFDSMVEDGPLKPHTKDVYLSPEEYSAWAEGRETFVPTNKAGVYSLGVSALDICTMDPSRQIYHFSQKQMDNEELGSRVEIAGKKYGSGVEKLLRSMLESDVKRRMTFTELEQQIPTFIKNHDSKMHLSVIPSQRSSYINNDNKSLRSSVMFKSVVSSSNVTNSRVFASKIKPNREDEELETVIENYTNGNKYSGQKKGTMKHGQGKYVFKDDSYYEGEWFDNKINGIGILYFPDGRPEYDGEWRNDEYNGWGTLYSPGQNWERYEGEFKNGLREGRGKIYFKNGTVYDGQFRGGKISGRGRKICPNGEVIDKYWDTISPGAFYSSS